MTSTASTGAGSLREAIVLAVPDEVIPFDAVVFPAGSLTWIELATALPILDDEGVVLDGAGRVGIRPATVLPSDSGLRVTGDHVSVTGLTISGFGHHGVYVQDALEAIIGAPGAESSDVRDVDLDGWPDLFTRHRAQDMVLAASPVIIHFGAYTTDDVSVARSRLVSIAASDPDGDGDGIHDACDACEFDGIPPIGPDGCAW